MKPAPVFAVVAFALSTACAPVQPRAADAPPPSAPAASAPAATVAVPEGPLVVPSTDGWAEIDAREAKLAVRLPPGASVYFAGSEGPTGRFVNIRLVSGVEFGFCERCSSEPITIAGTRSFYETRAIGFNGYLYEGADAVIAKRDEGGEVGAYCETTVCKDVSGIAFCAGSVGATIDGDKITKATTNECFAVVAIARSLRALP